MFLCSDVCRYRLVFRCSRWLRFQVGALAPEDFSVSNLPLRGFTAGCWIQRSCVCFSVPFASEIAWDSPIVNTVSQTINEQVSSSWIRWSLMANRFQSNVVCCLETKKCAVTSNYCMTLWRTPSDRWALRVQPTRNHARFTHCARRDYKLTSLGTSRGINLAFASGHFARNYWIHSRGLSWTHHSGSLPFIWVTTVLKRRS